jgi:aldehyde dehydrogenase (NAD+)
MAGSIDPITYGWHSIWRLPRGASHPGPKTVAFSALKSHWLVTRASPTALASFGTRQSDKDAEMQSTKFSDVARPSFVGGSKQLLIDGHWLAAASGLTFDTFNPATGQAIARLARGGQVDINDAVAAARRAFEGPWRRWTPHERRRLLLRIHDLIESHFEELALIETLDMGAPLVRTKALKTWASQVILFYAAQCGAASCETLPNSLPGHFATTKLKQPVGVVGGIIPWNAPLISQWWILGPTLATGCTAVLKPAEEASLTTLRVAELLLEAGLPEGVVNVVTGYGAEAGSALAEHVDVDRVAFTGSVDTARKIVHASAGNLKRLQLELGGKSPDVIFADADLDKAVPGAAMGVYANTGQICVAGTRVFVQRSIKDEFVERLRTYTATVRVGDGLDPHVQLGPLISEKQLQRVMGFVDVGSREGAKLSCGGKRLGGELAHGYFVEPTVFDDVTNDMTIAREEIFGPVLSVIPFDDLADALELANDTPYGLAGGVWTRSLATAHKMSEGLKAGTIWVNTYGVLDPNVGFGGYKLSGYGWKGSREHLDGFLYSKAVYMNLD